MPRYEQVQQQQQYVGYRSRRKRKKFKWKKICKQIILSWYTFGCLIITFYLYIFQSNLLWQNSSILYDYKSAIKNTCSWFISKKIENFK